MKNILMKTAIFVVLFLLFQFALDKGYELMNQGSDALFVIGAVMVAIVFATAIYGVVLMAQRVVRIIKKTFTK